MIRFDKDVLHVRRQLPAGPRNYLTVPLQAGFSENVPGRGSEYLRL